MVGVWLLSALVLTGCTSILPQVGRVPSTSPSASPTSTSSISTAPSPGRSLESIRVAVQNQLLGDPQMSEVRLRIDREFTPNVPVLEVSANASDTGALTDLMEIGRTALAEADSASVRTRGTVSTPRGDRALDVWFRPGGVGDDPTPTAGRVAALVDRTVTAYRTVPTDLTLFFDTETTFGDAETTVLLTWPDADAAELVGHYTELRSQWPTPTGIQRSTFMVASGARAVSDSVLGMSQTRTARRVPGHTLTAWRTLLSDVDDAQLSSTTTDGSDPRDKITFTADQDTKRSVAEVGRGLVDAHGSSPAGLIIKGEVGAVTVDFDSKACAGSERTTLALYAYYRSRHLRQAEKDGVDGCR